MNEPYYHDDNITLYHGDALEVARTLPDCAVDCIVTSPPYFGLRDYGVDGQYGLESSPAEYVETMRVLFAELRRVLADDGTLWLNIGDSYSRNAAKGGSGTPNGRNTPEMGYPDRRWREGSARADGAVRSDGLSRRNRNGCLNGDLPEKNLLGIPWRVAFALQDDGWILRNAIIWHKPNAMPESVKDRLSTRYEMLFMFSKQQRYWFDLDAVREPLAYPDAANTVGGNHTDIGNRRGGQYRADKTPYPPGMNPQTGRAATGKRHTCNDNGGRNPGDVWALPTQPFAAAHFAVYPVTLPTRCILAGCKPTRTCDCNETVATPTGTGERKPDPSQTTGRGGFNRPRRTSEGTRPISRRDQRHHAVQMKSSPHRSEMQTVAGPAFAHYIRTDKSGARPLPPELHADFIARGWITDPPPCTHGNGQPGVVFDPFNGSGTTGLAAQRTGRKYVGIDINAEYLNLSLRTRLTNMTLTFDGGNNDRSA